MATEEEVFEKADALLQARGYICGRDFADVGAVAKSIRAELMMEETMIKRSLHNLAAAGRFKQDHLGQISAFARSNPKCGN